MKTQALKRAHCTKYSFTAAFGSGRQNEKSRAQRTYLFLPQ